MKKITAWNSFTPREIEQTLVARDVEELESRFEMLIPVSWCTSGCGTEKTK